MNIFSELWPKEKFGELGKSCGCATMTTDAVVGHLKEVQALLGVINVDPVVGVAPKMSVEGKVGVRWNR